MRISSSARYLPLLSLAFVLGSCAYTTKVSFQDITFLSPGAQDAKCLVYVNEVKYQVRPPQTVNIKKSEKPMFVVCYASDDRSIEVEVLPIIEEEVIWGSPVGMGWDYASNSLYSYPEVIAIDFSQEEVKPFTPSDHNKPAELMRRGEGDDVLDSSEILTEEDPATKEDIEAVEEDEVAQRGGSAGIEESAAETEAVESAVTEGAVMEISGTETSGTETSERNSEANSAPVSLVPGE
ncbi:MAG: hypothetical protein KAJ29_05590 [Alphaproteobacteria bacterium]|nr:hypothetical protein [Alphaproteobacteria bacterium]